MADGATVATPAAASPVATVTALGLASSATRSADGLADASITATTMTAPGPSVLPLPSQRLNSCGATRGRHLAVGPGRDLAAPSAAAAIALDGDVIDIDAGDYTGDVAVWRASRLVICGKSGRARLFAAGQNAAGKGIWVVQGASVIIDGVEFHDARVADQNGAGIRAEGNGLTVRNSGFYDNENGILGPNQGDLTIESSEFARNGRGDGQTHNLYAGTANRLSVSASFFHETPVGHNLKSRARITVIEDSYFMDGPAGTASYQIDLPYGGTALLRGNLLFKGPAAVNSRLVSYGLEGLPWPANTLTMVHNTLVSNYQGGRFIGSATAIDGIVLTANLFAGNNGAELFGADVASKVTQLANVVSNVSHLPNAGDLSAPQFWPDAALAATTALSFVPDPGYAVDVPQPYLKRSFSGSLPRRAGALQSAP